MIEFSALLILVQAAPAPPEVPGPTTIYPEAYWDASRRHDKCLIDAADHIVASERDRHTRYGLYTKRCISERAEMIEAFIRANETRGYPGTADQRWRLFERASWQANDRARIWAARILDPKPKIVDYNPVETIGDAK